MKKLAVAFLILALAGSVLGSAQPSGADGAMNAFWEKFKAAVIKGDKEAVFALSALPIEMEYGMPRIRTKAQFMKNYKHIFAGEANAAKCLKTAKAELDSSNKKLFTVGCGFAEDTTPADQPLVYTFKLTRAGWRFVGYDNINE
ncbi:MAG TPA: hypothetical protein VIF81_01925 [Pyrinomonadaceae bacterium]|jgi:hypothetical protein